jgi:hypothetical protein
MDIFFQMLPVYFEGK